MGALMSTILTNLRRSVSAALRGSRVAVLVLGLAASIGMGLWFRVEWAVRAEARAARRAVAAGRFPEAEAPIGRWLAARPHVAEAHFLKAQVAFGRERPQEAIVELAKARSLGHPAPPIDRLEAILRVRAGRYAEAEPILRRILEQATGPDAEVEEALARTYLETYDFPAASAVLDRWMRDVPQDPKPYLWRVEVDERLDPGPAKSIADFREALRRDPHLDRARLGLADKLRSIHRHAEAAADYSAYLARRPDDPAALVGAGLTALESGDEVAAQRLLDRALELAPAAPSALRGRARLALRRGEPAAALAWLDRAIRVQPHEVEIHYERAICLAQLGRRDEARAEQAAVKRLRQDDDAREKIQHALVRDPRNIALQAEIARWLVGHGHEEEGCRWARKIVGEQPRHPEANRLLADYHERQGQAGLANFYRLQAAPSR
jgi:tetratricopeptide (TPR) repeat protein